MQKAVISGDIIAFTSLSNIQKQYIEEGILELFGVINNKFDVFSRLVKGDFIEILVKQPEYSLQIALIIKSYIKSLVIVEETDDNRLKYFKIYGMRLAIGLGEISRFNAEKGIIDGDAIYRSGRLINDLHTHQKQRIHIKQSLFFSSGIENLNMEMDAIFSLLDNLLAQATPKQSKVLYYKLLGYNEKQISSMLNITVQAVSRRSNPLGWYAIKKAVDYYEYRFKNLVK